MSSITDIQLPGLNCGLCGYRTCDEFQERLAASPEMLRRCIHLSKSQIGSDTAAENVASRSATPQAAGRIELATACGTCGAEQRSPACASRSPAANVPGGDPAQTPWQDSLGREFDFFLEHFPEEPGPREIILPHNPLLTRELDVRQGDVLIGRPLGMSCGCPITHCGVVMEADHRTGVIVWCVTGPLGPRQSGFKDLGYYIAEAYEGLVYESRCELKLGLRYFFQPKMCMLQWRHSGLLNYVSRTRDGHQIRIAGLWIG